ncbi:MAG TPA: acetolactate synthase small subunit [bacterium]|nr:acetolactate synthase small subunit [bacterium]
MKHTISVTVENKFGVLARVSGLFSSRGYNIDSLAVGMTQDPNISRMTIVVKGDDRILEQVIKQLDKLIDVIEVTDLKKGSYVGRELTLIKVKCNSKTRTEVLEITNVFRAKAIDIGHNTLILQITGSEEKVEAFIKLMEPFGILELARTGKVAMLRELNEQPLNEGELE